MLRYREIKNALIDMIADMSNGDKIPSRTVLTKKLDSSRATIDKAIKELEEEGILQAHFGSGTYVARRLEGVSANVKNWCLIIPDITEPIYAKLARSVENTAQEYNINVILCNAEHSVEKQSEYIRRLILAGVDGFIIVPAVIKNVMEGVSLYQSLKQSQIPFVFCNREVEGVMAPIVKSNDFYGGYLAALYLLDRGYRNIAFFSKMRYRTSVERCQGYISALQQRNIEIVRKRIVMLEDGSDQECRDKLKELLKSGTEVDAVFCFNDVIASIAVQVIEEMGLKISEDIGVIGYDNNENAASMNIPLTSISYRTEDIGRLAANVLVKMSERREKDVFGYYLVEPRVVERESCKGKRIQNAMKRGSGEIE